MDSAFFGPDTYLFLDFLSSCKRHMPQAPRTTVDICCGPGAGAIHMALNFAGARTIGLDLNPKALALAELNGRLTGLNVEFVYSDLYSSLPDLLQGTKVNIIVADPPYLGSNTDDTGPVPIYADGGSSQGLEISMRIVKEGGPFLAPGGLLAIFTATTIPAADPSHDPWLTWLQGQQEYKLVNYHIYFPDMWSEEIGKGVYTDAARIQVVGALLQKL